MHTEPPGLGPQFLHVCDKDFDQSQALRFPDPDSRSLGRDSVGQGSALGSLPSSASDCLMALGESPDPMGPPFSHP